MYTSWVMDKRECPAGRRSSRPWPAWRPQRSPSSWPVVGRAFLTVDLLAVEVVRACSEVVAGPSEMVFATVDGRYRDPRNVNRGLASAHGALPLRPGRVVHQPGPEGPPGGDARTFTSTAHTCHEREHSAASAGVASEPSRWTVNRNLDARHWSRQRAEQGGATRATCWKRRA